MIGAGVVNEFDATSIKLCADPKVVYLKDLSGAGSVFPYDIYCQLVTFNKIHFFFHFSTSRVLITFANVSTHKCGLMRFWMHDDEPIPAADWIFNMSAMIKTIQPQFSEQFAAYTLDKIINADDS